MDGVQAFQLFINMYSLILKFFFKNIILILVFLMKPCQANRLKALFLLTVFSLNTIAGFACSIGVDMGYNAKHHEHNQSANSKMQHHAVQHYHDISEWHNNVQKTSFNAPNDDCCSHQVNSFVQLDKSVAYNNLLLQSPIFILPHFIWVLNSETQESGNLKGFLFVRRSCFLNNNDIRIAIQSFQI